MARDNQHVTAALTAAAATIGAGLLLVFTLSTFSNAHNQTASNPPPASEAQPLEPQESHTPSSPPSVATQATPVETMSSPSATPRPKQTIPKLTDLLAKVDTVPKRIRPGGYDRSCSPGSRCVFGEPWTDNNRTTFGRNGCDTRNDVLGRSLKNIVFKPGTNNCTVLSGNLVDPYTGKPIAFERGWGKSNAIEIDHLIPLAAAWDMGASRWDQQRRIDFANDVELVLIAVDGPTNQAKSDSTPAAWLPPNKSFRCEYGIRYVQASISWDLPITEADHQILTKIAATCD